MNHRVSKLASFCSVRRALPRSKMKESLLRLADPNLRKNCISEKIAPRNLSEHVFDKLAEFHDDPVTAVQKHNTWSG